MKKIILSLILLLFTSCWGISLKGGVSETYIPSGFYGTWGVISKLTSSDKPELFNYESRDIWTLSGQGNTLFLENLQTGAKSQITIKDKSIDGKTLKFNRENKVQKGAQTHVYKETVTFTLFGNNFSGTDKYIFEKYENNKLISKNEGNYTVAGVRISGSNTVK